MESGISSAKRFISCDWGTSRFRLRLVSENDGAILADWSTDDGIGRFITQPAFRDAASREQLLLQFLGKQSRQILANGDAYLPIVVSGMASSSIGIRELDYATLPFSISGADAVSTWIEPGQACPHRVLLLSGVRSEHDAMRGEETQLTGLLQQQPSYGEVATVFIFPGTHSKHIYVDHGYVKRLRTFLTGEVFASLTQHSILSDSVTTPSEAALDAETASFFLDGVHASGAGSLLNMLFTARTNSLFRRMSKAHNYYYLSGLLIGEELRHIDRNDHPIVLCAGHSLHPYYLSALRALRLDQAATVVSEEIADHCIVAGQLAAYRNKIQTS